MKYLLPILMPLVFCLSTARADEADARGKPSITVAAIPFHQASAKETYGPLAEAVGDLLVARLEAVEGLVFVNRAAIDKVLDEQKLSLAASPADRVRVGKIVGARYVLAGSVVPVGDTFQINCAPAGGQYGPRRARRPRWRPAATGLWSPSTNSHGSWRET